MDSDTQLYELGFTLSPSLTEEEAKEFHQKIKSEAQELGALIDEEGSIEKRRLSYPIKKVREAYFGFFKFILSPEKLADLKLKMNTPSVLRCLFIKTKRAPQRQISTRPMKMADTSLNQTETSEYKQTVIKTQEAIDIAPPINIEEIDKKLEEILGK